MTPQTFDVIVIGSGAGAKISSYAAKQGMKVALVEEGPIGGTCLNRGCIPSKLYIHTADVVKTIREADKFNVTASVESIDFPAIVKRVTSYVDGDSQKMAQANENNPNITLFRARGKFVDTKVIEVDGQRITAEKILIAAGARTTVPSVAGLADTPYITSEEALRLEKLPKKLIVIGGGYIGTELGHFLGSLGSEVTIVQSRDVLLPNEDYEVAQKFTDVFARSHTVLLKHRAQKVSHDGTHFTVSVKGSDGEKDLVGDQLLVAAGVLPNSDTTDVAASGIDTNDKGYIQVNEYLETNVPGIWALGDIIGKHMFRHSANWEARYAISNMFSEAKYAVDYTAMPHAVFSSPQIAGVGATEEELKEQGIGYKVGTLEYSKTAMGVAHLDYDGFAKVLVSEDKKKILGFHIVGPEASTAVHEVVVAMKMGAAVASIMDTIHIHPALSEVVQRAFWKIK